MDGMGGVGSTGRGGGSQEVGVTSQVEPEQTAEAAPLSWPWPL